MSSVFSPVLSFVCWVFSCLVHETVVCFFMVSHLRASLYVSFIFHNLSVKKVDLLVQSADPL